MFKSIFLVLFIGFQTLFANSQVFNEKDSLLYVDSTYKVEYSGFLTDFHANGQMSKKINYLNGVPHGDLYIYHENGQLAGNAIYENGQLHGTWYKYYETGAVLGKGTYLKGKIHGETIWYDPEGKVSNFYAIPLRW